MFISFGMFIGLIILTIFMIILIIYLTFTGGDKKSRHKNTRNAEKAAQERLAQNNASQMSDSPLDHTNLENQDKFQPESELENHSYQETQYEDTIEDDYSLHILPYPKDDEYK